MGKKVIDLGDEPRKQKPMPLEEVAKIAFREYLNPAFLATVGKEPAGLASGQTNAQGGFVRADDDDLLADEDRVASELDLKSFQATNESKREPAIKK